jgi:hypothetical protein
MIERLRAVSAPVRYSIYFVGVVFALLVTVGVGAAAGVVAGWQSGWVGAATPTGSGSEKAGATKASEGTAIEPSSVAVSPGAD